VSCTEVHSQARELMAQDYRASLVATTLVIGQPSLHYQKQPQGSRADRTYDERIVVACGEKLAYAYWRVSWQLQRKKGLRVNRERVLQVMRGRGLLVRSRRLRARRKMGWSRMEGREPNPIWQADMTRIWASASVDCAYVMSVIDCFTLEIVGWNLSPSCRTEDTLAAAEQAALTRFSSGSRDARLTLITDGGTQYVATYPCWSAASTVRMKTYPLVSPTARISSINSVLF
jgi:transposase InsO family protein